MSLEEVENLTSSEIMYWQDFFSIYPFTQDREDIRMAQLICAIYTSQGGKPKFEDYIPDYLGDKKAKPNPSLRSIFG